MNQFLNHVTQACRYIWQNLEFALLIGGLCIFGIGFIFAWIPAEIAGLSLVASWLVNRVTYNAIVRTVQARRSHDQKLAHHQADWDAGVIIQTEQSHKELKDEYDWVKHLTWKIAALFWNQRLVWAVTGFILLFAVLLGGPGNVFPWHWKDVADVAAYKAVQSADHLTGNQPARGILAQTKAGWEKNQQQYVREMLTWDRNVSHEDYEALLNREHVDLGAVIAVIHANPRLKGRDLYDHITAALDSNQKNEASAPTLKEKGAWQKWREKQWLFFLLVEIAYLGVIAILAAITIVSWMAMYAYAIGDESWDRIKLFFAEAYNRRAQAKSAGQEITAEAAGADKGSNSMDIFNSVMGNTLAAIFTRILDKPLQKYGL